MEGWFYCPSFQPSALPISRTCSGRDLGQLYQGLLDLFVLEFVIEEFLSMVGVVGRQVEMAVAAVVEENDLRLA